MSVQPEPHLPSSIEQMDKAFQEAESSIDRSVGNRRHIDSKCVKQMENLVKALDFQAQKGKELSVDEKRQIHAILDMSGNKLAKGTWGRVDTFFSKVSNYLFGKGEFKTSGEIGVELRNKILEKVVFGSPIEKTEELAAEEENLVQAIKETCTSVVNSKMSLGAKIEKVCNFPASLLEKHSSLLVKAMNHLLDHYDGNGSPAEELLPLIPHIKDHQERMELLEGLGKYEDDYPVFLTAASLYAPSSKAVEGGQEILNLAQKKAEEFSAHGGFVEEEMRLFALHGKDFLDRPLELNRIYKVWTGQIDSSLAKVSAGKYLLQFLERGKGIGLGLRKEIEEKIASYVEEAKQPEAEGRESLLLPDTKGQESKLSMLLGDQETLLSKSEKKQESVLSKEIKEIESLYNNLEKVSDLQEVRDDVGTLSFAKRDEIKAFFTRYSDAIKEDRGSILQEFRNSIEEDVTNVSTWGDMRDLITVIEEGVRRLESSGDGEAIREMADDVMKDFKVFNKLTEAFQDDERSFVMGFLQRQLQSPIVADRIEDCVTQFYGSRESIPEDVMGVLKERGLFKSP